MNPSIDSIKASDGTAPASLATIQNVRAPLAATIIVNTVSGINTNFHGSMGTPHTFTDPITSETITVISQATNVDFRGHVDGTNLVIDEIAPGFTDAGSEVGDIIIIKPTTQGQDETARVLEVSHNDDGSIKELSVYSAIDTKGIKGDETYFTASGTYTKPADLKFIIVEVQGGGGSGGGADSLSGNSSIGGPGGGGGYSRKKILASALDATETVTVGAGGVASGSSNSPGNTGGSSSFGVHCSVSGGGGGSPGADTTTAAMPAGSGANGAGGTATGGDINIPGSEGTRGIMYRSASTMSGNGGGSFLAPNSGVNTVGNLVANGIDGKGYGGGSSGGCSSGASTAEANGGVGSSGIVIVHEYF